MLDAFEARLADLFADLMAAEPALRPPLRSLPAAAPATLIQPVLRVLTAVATTAVGDDAPQQRRRADGIGLRTVLPAALALAAPGAFAVALIKPQFEVGREHIGKGGIVTDEAAVAAAIERITTAMAEAGWAFRFAVASPITGGDGNRETVAGFRRR